MIEVDSRQFGRALALAATVLYRRNSIPALGALRATPHGALLLEGSDLDTFSRVALPYDGDEADSFMVNDPFRLRSAIGAAGGTTVSLTPTEDALGIRAGALQADLAAMAADQHPGFERIAVEEFAVDLGQAALAQILRVMPAISTEETRYYLNGIFAHKVDEWTYRFAATDGHRLMVVDVPLPGAIGEIGSGIIIPKRWLDIVKAQMGKAKNPLRLTYGGRAIRNEAAAALDVEAKGAPLLSVSTLLDGLHFILSTKLIDGTYPDYQRVIPSEWPMTARVNRSDLAQAIHAVTAFSNEKTRAVRLTFDQRGLEVALKSPEFGNGPYRIAAERTFTDDLTIGFNARYLLDALAAYTGKTIDFGLTDPAAPTIITDPADPQMRVVLMPMRV